MAFRPGGSPLSDTKRSSKRISFLVSARVGGTFGAARLSIVNQKMRQLTMQKTDIRFTSRSAVRSFEFRLCIPTRGFVEHFDLPAQCIPLELLHSVLERSNREIGDQLPDDLLPVLGLATFSRMDHRQLERWILFLLADRWLELKLFELISRTAMVGFALAF